LSILQSVSNGGRIYQLCKNVPGNRCKASAHQCASFLWGQPYLTLTPQDVCNNYYRASLSLIAAACATGTAIFTTHLASQQTYTDNTDLENTIEGCVLLYGMALGAAFVGVKTIYKTCVAPKFGEREPLLPL
jgi:hypothetical protein